MLIKKYSFFLDLLRMTVSKQNEVFLSFHVPTCWMWLDHKCYHLENHLLIIILFFTFLQWHKQRKKNNFIQTLKLQIKLINLVKAEYSGLSVVFLLFSICRLSSEQLQSLCSQAVLHGCLVDLQGLFQGKLFSFARRNDGDRLSKLVAHDRVCALCLKRVKMNDKVSRRGGLSLQTMQHIIAQKFWSWWDDDIRQWRCTTRVNYKGDLGILLQSWMATWLHNSN